MKKTSLASLKAAGWKVSQADEERLDRHQIKQQLSTTADRITQAVDAIKDAATAGSGQLEALVAEQTKAIMHLTNTIVAQRPAGWEFNVQRNKSGFISKVYAKRTD
jgi:hypothetical protein